MKSKKSNTAQEKSKKEPEHHGKGSMEKRLGIIFFIIVIIIAIMGIIYEIIKEDIAQEKNVPPPISSTLSYSTDNTKREEILLIDLSRCSSKHLHVKNGWIYANKNCVSIGGISTTR